MQPWADALYKTRRENLSIDDPVGHCIMAGVPRADAVPYPWKIINSAGEMAILYEAVHGFRQIFLDEAVAAAEIIIRSLHGWGIP